jgi:esterase/lipase
MKKGPLMKMERFTFPNVRGELLSARLELPEDEEPLAYALFAHCFACSKNMNAVVHISRALISKRIAMLRFDFTGHGESEGDFSSTTFSSQVNDLVSAARFLEQNYQAPRLLIGHSLGGTAVLAAASEIPSTMAVVTIAAPFHPNQLRELFGDSLSQISRNGHASVCLHNRDFTIRQSLLDDLEAQHPEETLKRLSAALLVIHAPHDEVVGVENASQIFRAAHHPKSLIFLDQADHLLSDDRDARYVGEVTAAWAGRYIAQLSQFNAYYRVTD